MLEREPFRVKKRALQAGHRADIAWHAPVNATVHRVANDGMADRAEMHANLVRASGVNGHLAERQAWHLERAGDSGNGFPRASRPRGHLLPMDWIAADGGIDTPAGRYGTPHERDIFLLDLAILELPRQFLVRGIVLRDDHHAGRAAIEAVDDSRPQHAADAAEVGDVVQQRIDERARGVTRAGMHDHARRLVDDDRS